MINRKTLGCRSSVAGSVEKGPMDRFALDIGREKGEQ